LINHIPNRESVNLSLSTTSQGLSTAAGFSVSELFSDWDFEEVSESLLLETVDWVVIMVLLRIWKV